MPNISTPALPRGGAVSAKVVVQVDHHGAHVESITHHFLGGLEVSWVESVPLHVSFRGQFGVPRLAKDVAFDLGATIMRRAGVRLNGVEHLGRDIQQRAAAERDASLRRQLAAMSDDQRRELESGVWSVATEEHAMADLLARDSAGAATAVAARVRDDSKGLFRELFFRTCAWRGKFADVDCVVVDNATEGWWLAYVHVPSGDDRVIGFPFEVGLLGEVECVVELQVEGVDLPSGAWIGLAMSNERGDLRAVLAGVEFTAKQVRAVEERIAGSQALETECCQADVILAVRGSQRVAGCRKCLRAVRDAALDGGERA